MSRKKVLVGNEQVTKKGWKPAWQPQLTCNTKGDHHRLRSSYLIAAPILGGQFKAGFFLGIFSQVGGHPYTVALNEKGPFGLLACKTGKLPVSPERRKCQGKASSLLCKIKPQKQLLHPWGTTIVKERLLGKLKNRLRRQRGRYHCQAREMLHERLFCRKSTTETENLLEC